MAKKPHPNSLANLEPFEPGQSGNPAGARKGKRFKTVIKEFLDMTALLTFEDQERGLIELFSGKLGRDLTHRELIVFRQMRKAAAGDTAAFNALADREEGKPAQTNLNKNLGMTYTDYLDALKSGGNEDE